MVFSVKILVKIIGTQIKPKIKLQPSNDQFRFTRNKRTREVIPSLRTLIGKQI